MILNTFKQSVAKEKKLESKVYFLNLKWLKTLSTTGILSFTHMLQIRSNLSVCTF